MPPEQKGAYYRHSPVGIMRLKDVFVEMLKSKGIERVGTRLRKVVSSQDPIRMMALYVANGKASVCEGSGGLQHSLDLNGNFVSEPPQAYVGNCDGKAVLSREELLSTTDFPYIVVDCRFYDLHSEKEKRKLGIQVKQTLGVIREYMWDEKLIISGIDFGFGCYYPSTEEFLAEKNISRIVLLDPNAEKVFDGSKAECYIIGGIVDKSGNKRGLTSKIGEQLEKAGFDVDSRKILLRGDIVGVPDRINHIAEIVLKVILDGKDVESAIREVQPPIVAKWRLRKDLHERTIRVCCNGRVFRVVAKSAFSEFAEWLNIRWRDFYEVCREQRFFVVSDEVMERIKSSRWDEKLRCFLI